MKAKVNKTNVTFRDVMNESQHELVTRVAAKAKATIETKDFGTTIIVKGDQKTLATFILQYNASR